MENEVKEPAPKYNYISREEYLEMERADEKRNEYYDGHVVETPATNLIQARIAIRLVVMIGNFINDKDCNILRSKMRIGTPAHDAYMYADALIYCGEPELEDDKSDTLLNPAIIIEILSPFTKNIDKKGKFLYYRKIPSLKEYIVIDPAKRSIIAVRKQPDYSWKIQDLNENDSELILETICYKLPLSEIYNNAGI